MDDNTVLEHLQGFLPAPILAALHEYVLRQDAPLPQWANSFAQQVVRGAEAVSPYTSQATAHLGAMATPLLDRVAAAFYNAPDVVVLGFVLVLFFVAFQILSLVRRLVAWTTRLAFRMMLWAAIGLVLAAIWQRGLERSAQDAAALVGRLLGYAAFVRDIWQAEYHKYQQQQQQAAAAAAASGGGGGSAAVAAHAMRMNNQAAYRPGGAGGWSGRR